MPLKVARFCTSVLLLFATLAFVAAAQNAAPSPTVISSPIPAPPTSGDVMRERISKAKAFIAVRNYNAAIYELESIRKESSDTAVHGVVSVLLMNSYLEQSDYKRAQEFLNETFKQQKTTRPNAGEIYMAVASQVVKGARGRAERYRTLGINISDRMLPLEALNDLEKMRETIELVIAQSKEIGKTPAKASGAMMLLEEAINSRTTLARDDYDARKWKDEVADTREAMANSRSVVLSAVQGEPTGELPKPELVASNPPVVMQPVSDVKTQPQPPEPVVKPAPEPEQTAKPAEIAPVPAGMVENTTVASASKPDNKPITSPAPTSKTEPVAEPTPMQQTTVKPGPSAVPEVPNNSNGPLEVGSLIGYATKQAAPTYPAAARAIRSVGIVRVDVTIDEAGDVTEVQKTSGPPLLQAAARDAIKRWKFKPFLRDGQPVKATGFINFNFAL